MSKAVRYDSFGPIENLYIADVELPQPAAGEVQIQVKAAGINPGEAAIRKGFMNDVSPSTFPSGQGSDFAGVVTSLGDGVTSVSVGDEVLGWNFTRSSQAELTNVPADQLVAKPAGLSWEQAGALYVVGATAFAAVRAVDVQSGDAVVVSAAAGGVGGVTVQLAKLRGAEVIGIASESNHDWLRSKGITPVAYGDGLADRIRELAPNGVDAFIDTFGPEYVHLAVELGVAKDRIDTIIAFQAAEELGVKAEGSSEATTQEVLAEMADHVASGRIELPIAQTFPLDQVQAAFTELEQRHTRGKIVLIP